jgi:hypothetical protein
MHHRLPIVAGLATVALVGSGCPGGTPGNDGTAELDGFEYRVETHVAEAMPPVVYGSLFVENTGDQAAEVTFPDACVLLLRAYRTPERTDQPAWDQQRETMCAQMLVQQRLEPGQTFEHQTQVSAAEILGDSLPPGRYYLTALVRPEGQAVELLAGEADLSLQPR